ncbi:hypothetical protein [Arthrobacter sp. TE12231]
MLGAKVLAVLQEAVVAGHFPEPAAGLSWLLLAGVSDGVGMPVGTQALRLRDDRSTILPDWSYEDESADSPCGGLDASQGGASGDP